MHRLGGLLVLAIGALSGCSTSQVLLPHRTELALSDRPVSEELLLDVGIEVFDPGVPEGELDTAVQEKLLEEGVFVHIRRVEAVHMAVQLRKTMQRSGHWGSVWITPDEAMSADVMVDATILQSDGYIVRADVRVYDAQGHTWIDKRYELETAASAYDRESNPGLDPYQDLYNSIANDIAAVRGKLSNANVESIKTVGVLRYAQDLSPAAFHGYLAERRGEYSVKRLPARDDPMLEKIERVMQRERLFVEILDLHYEDFARTAGSSYDSWREYAREEAITLTDLTRSARWRTGLGIAAILASLAFSGGADSGAFMDSSATQGLMLTGSALFDMAALDLRDKEVHAAQLEELSMSFDDEAAPIVVEIEGVEHRFVGAAKEQYAELRNRLRRVLAEERGLQTTTTP